MMHNINVKIDEAEARRIVKHELTKMSRGEIVQLLVETLDDDRNRLLTVHNLVAFAKSGRKYTVQVKEVEQWPMKHTR